MIAKAELRRIAAARLADAELLLRNHRYDGAIYLSGYAVEITLKLRICKTLRWVGFPETNSEFQGLQSLRTHDFEMLLHLSDIEDKVKASYITEWAIVKLWKPELRYTKTGITTATDASLILDAVKTILAIL